MLAEVPGVDLRGIRQQLRVRPVRPLIVRPALTPQRMPHRGSGHSQLATDGAYPDALRIQIPNRCPRFHAKHPFWSSSWTLVHEG